jgi:hypothetical protein
VKNFVVVNLVVLVTLVAFLGAVAIGPVAFVGRAVTASAVASIVTPVEGLNPVALLNGPEGGVWSLRGQASCGGRKAVLGEQEDLKQLGFELDKE